MLMSSTHFQFIFILSSTSLIIFSVYTRDNIQLDLREIGIDGANWIQLAQDRVQWRACVNTVMNVQVPYEWIFFDKLSDNQFFK
jgi:hypothetical protein